MKAALQGNRRERRKVRLLDDNARSHTAKLTQQKLKGLGQEVLPHAAYWPDLAPSDRHLFCSLRIHPITKCFDYETDLSSALEVFFSFLSKKFFEDGIVDLPKRGEYVIDNNGVHVID